MFDQSTLNAIRAAHVAAVDEAALQDRRLASPDVSMPKSLQAAAMWLADQGARFEASEGELFYGWTPSTCRSYLNGLSPTARSEEVERGRRVIFDGGRGRAPLYRPVASVDGLPVDGATAAEFRQLGQPRRKVLGCKFDRVAA